LLFKNREGFSKKHLGN